MGRHDGDAAAGAMRTDRGFQALPAGLIEADARLVEQPQRARHREQPRQGRASPLAGREMTRGQIGQGQQVEAGEPRCRASATPARAEAKARFSLGVSAIFSASAWAT